MDWFGEVAVVKNIARTATVKAKTKLRLFSIDAELFMQFVFPMLEEKFMSAMDAY